MGMGMNQNQVYYDPATGQYYPGVGYNYYTGVGYNNGFFQRRNYLNQPTVNQNPTPSSNTTKLIEQAMSAQANPVSMAQLFPYMNYGATNNIGNMGGLGGLLGLTGTGSSGAGRFLSTPTSNSTTM